MEKREIQAPKCEIFLEFRMRNIMRLEGSWDSVKLLAIKLTMAADHPRRDPPTLQLHNFHLPRIKSFIYHTRCTFSIFSIHTISLSLSRSQIYAFRTFKFTIVQCKAVTMQSRKKKLHSRIWEEEGARELGRMKLKWNECKNK